MSDQQKSATTSEPIGQNCAPPSDMSPPNCAADEATTDGEKGTPSQAFAIADFVDHRADLICDENKDVFVHDRRTGETCRIDGQQFADWVSAGFYVENKKAVSRRSLTEAISTLSGLARHRNRPQEVHVRIARHSDAYYLDLGQPGNSRAVKVAVGHWEIVDKPPVLFTRAPTSQALPVPESGGTLRELWRFANIPVGARPLVLAWLLDCLRPETPFPLLELVGEQGSGKSLTQRILRQLVDPSSCPLRKQPKNSEEAFLGARANLIASFENVSNLPWQLQDDLCMIATGASHVARKLYTNGEEYPITAKRPIVLNCIAPVVTRSDLLDRAVSIEVERITDRQSADALLALFYQKRGSLLGALLDLMVDALARRPDVTIPPNRRPRLLEFAELGEAMALAQGGDRGDFLRLFKDNRRETIGRTIDANPVAAAMVDWFAANDRRPASMTTQQWLEVLDKHKRSGSEWPKSPRALGDLFRRVSPDLREFGIGLTAMGHTNKGNKFAVSALCQEPAGEHGERREHPAEPVSKASRCSATGREPGEHGERHQEIFARHRMSPASARRATHA